MLLLKALLISMMIVAASACREEPDPQERVTKLRAIGSQTSPVVATPSDTTPNIVNVTVLALVPPGETVAAQRYVDKSARYSYVIADLDVDEGGIAYDDSLNGLR